MIDNAFNQMRVVEIVPDVGFLQQSARSDLLVNSLGGTMENISENAVVDVVDFGVVGFVDACDVAVEKLHRTAQIAVDVGGGKGFWKGIYGE